MSKIKTRAVKLQNSRQIVVGRLVLTKLLYNNCQPHKDGGKTDEVLWNCLWLKDGHVTKGITSGTPYGALLVGHKPVVPIFISTTEEPTDGDYFYSQNPIGSSIHLYGGVFGMEYLDKDTGKLYLKDECYKILALPEHFSEEHIQMILEEKLKYDESYHLICGNTIELSNNEIKLHPDFYVKLDSDNHLILDTQDDIKYSLTKTELENLFNAARERIKHPDWDYVHTDFDDWFNTNILKK